MNTIGSYTADQATGADMLTIFARERSNKLAGRCSVRNFVRAGENSDEGLIDAIAHNDHGAMRTLYVRHNVKVFRFLSRLTNDQGLAEDLVSTVFFEAWKSARTFRGGSKASTWLLAIARHQALSALRQRRDMQLDEDFAETIEDPADSADAAIEKQERAEILQQCLRRLSPAHREVVDLIYYHEKPIDEVAEILGIPPATVKTRAFYARNKLAEMLNKQGIAWN